VTRDAIQEALVGILATSLGVSLDDARTELAISGGACDSLIGVEVIIALEETFGISVPDDAVTDICESIPAMVEFVAARLS